MILEGFHRGILEFDHAVDLENFEWEVEGGQIREDVERVDETPTKSRKNRVQ